MNVYFNHQVSGCAVITTSLPHPPRFRTPLLRGEPSTRLDQFKKIEALISSDLDHWLCNLYFQVRVSLSPERKGAMMFFGLSVCVPFSGVLA